ncbi:MAG: hypothetical protein WCO96_02805 [Actinomycetes bacterium]
MITRPEPAVATTPPSAIRGSRLALALIVAASALAGPAAGGASAATSPSTSTACTNYMNSFLSQAAAGTWSSPMQTVAMTVPASINNPAVSGTTTSPQTVTVTFTAYDASGQPVTPSPSNPLQVAIYSQLGAISAAGQPLTGADPYSFTVTSGNSFSFTYNGTYLNRPPTVTAWMTLASTNQCTGTANKAIGSTVLPLANVPTKMGSVSYLTPTVCKTGTGRTCAQANVQTNGLWLNAAVGFGKPMPGVGGSTTRPTSSNFDQYQIDTGSIGAVAPVTDLGPNVVGPGAPSWKYYDSSGFEFAGFTYLAPVTLSMKGVKPFGNPVRMLGVVTSACAPNKPCSGPPQFSNFHYMGVGIDRENNTSADPFASPGDNALLSIRSTNSNPISQGYLLSGGSIRVGLTAATGVTYTKQQLAPNPDNPGDWNAAAGCVAFPTPGSPPPTPLCGSLLMDVGIQQMYVSVAPGNLPAAVQGGLSSTQQVQITSPNSTDPALNYSFVAGPRVNNHLTPNPVGRAPSYVSLFTSSTDTSGQAFTGDVQINTGRYVLFGSNYMFNAQKGQIGFKNLANPLR